MLRTVNRRVHGVRAEREAGLAMVMVMAAAMVLTLVITAAIMYSTGTMRRAHNDQDWNAALAAANAGVEEYLSRINEDPLYYIYGNPDSDYTPDSARLPEASGAPSNQALLGWQELPASDGRAYFHYEVDAGDYGNTGVLNLRSTGRVGEATRTVTTRLTQVGFIDFLYFTDLETDDPATYYNSYWQNWAQENCTKYEYQYPGQERPEDCGMIEFIQGDTFWGPVHSNDIMHMSGAKFEGPVTSSWNSPPDPNQRYVLERNRWPTFARAGDPAFQERLELPQTNSAIKAETDPGLTAEPGCLYTGPTSITFHDNGQMTVRSPFTKQVNSGCGTPSSLRSSTGDRIAVPNNKVVYVQTVPASSSDPNYWSSSESGRPSCTEGTGKWKRKVNPLGYPIRTSKGTDITSYGCEVGDVFVEGVLDGRVTIASENDIVITGDTRYREYGTDGADDLLGIIANNYVWLYNPVNSYGENLVPVSDRRVDAAVLAVNHSFGIQHYYRGDYHGELSINGALAQKHRGPVAGIQWDGSLSGFTKKYVYDNRLKFTAPPKFLEPEKTVWGINLWTEDDPAHRFDAF